MGIDYPEQDRRERLLRGIHEWDLNRTDLRQPLAADRIVEMGGGEERVLNLFLILVREGYIDADPVAGSKDKSAPFGMAYVRGLHTKGLRAIGELPNPQESLVAGIEAAIQAIREDRQIEEAEKKRRIEVLEEAKQIGRPLAVEVIKGMFRGELPLL
jgi:glycerate kinase